MLRYTSRGVLICSSPVLRPPFLGNQNTPDARQRYQPDAGDRRPIHVGVKELHCECKTRSDFGRWSLPITANFGVIRYVFRFDIYSTSHILRIGIGNKKILEKVGIETLIDLPSVGENLQVWLAIHNYYSIQMRPFRTILHQWCSTYSSQGY